MRLRYLLPCMGVLVALSLLYVFYPRAEEGDNLGAFDTWNPTSKEIAVAVGTRSAGEYKDARHEKFATLFKNRFRERQHAVGLKFLSDTKIKAMFSALIPRWDMVRVAVDAANEAQTIFGKSFDVDIYETYISLRQKKLAEVRLIPGTARYYAYFDPKFWREMMMTEISPRHGPLPVRRRPTLSLTPYYRERLRLK